MLLYNGVNLYMMISLWIINGISAISYNRPKFCPNATWDSNATTMVNGTIIGTQPYGLFVTKNNTVYASGRNIDRIEIWGDGGAYHIKSIPANLSHPLSLFVTDDGNIYVDNGRDNHRVDLWTMNANYSVPVMHVNHSCAGLFVDTNNTLYCSMWFYHQVIKKSLDNTTDPTAIAAGTGCAGFLPDRLDRPCGIVVDFNFTLFIADCGNNRIQRFEWGQLNGTTVAGNGAAETVALNCPVGVALDADNYLFIVDRGSGRVFASNIYGFRCIVGCHGVGSTSYQLNWPETPAFDSYGNLFVTDGSNNRNQKFSLATNCCEKTTLTTIQSSTALSTMLITTELSSYSSNQTRPSYFSPASCPNSSHIGIYCNVSNTPCDTLEPCQNNGSCINRKTSSYLCICPLGFTGAECQVDNRPCKPHTCSNQGNCTEMTDNTFRCTCAFGWTGNRCEIMINYCDNVSCQNKGVCRPLLGKYKCECLGDSFSGEHCEKTAADIVVRQAVSKSFAYVAILAMVCVVGFIVVMDILKYGFGIDPVREELKRIRREKRAKRAKPPVIVRHTYVNAPPESEQQISAEETTTV